jgi:hypothetical protein
MKLGVALKLGRVSNLPTVITNVLAAIALSGARPAVATVVAICAGISLLYIAGMYLNDAFDRTIDALERPERPIPSGQVTAAEVFGAGFALMAVGVLVIAGVAFTVGAGWWPIASVVGLAALIVFYDMHHKTNPLAPLVMGLCRVGAYTTAALAAGGPLGNQLLIGCGLLLAYLIGLTFIARGENRKPATVMPRRWNLSDLRPLVFLAAPLVALQPVGQGPFVFAIYFMLLGWTARCVRLVIRAEMRAAVGGLIAGISLLDALFVIRTGQPAIAGVCCAAFLLTTIFQRRIAGT